MSVTGIMREQLHDIAMSVCVDICKYREAYMTKAEVSSDPESDYERLCIEHCDECPLNRLGIWNGDDWNDFGS